MLLRELSIEYALKQVEHGLNAFSYLKLTEVLIPEEMYKNYASCFKTNLNAVREKGIPTIYFPKNFGRMV